MTTPQTSRPATTRDERGGGPAGPGGHPALPGGGDGGGVVPPRPGVGSPGRPGMGWTELVVGAVLFVVFVFSTSFGWVLVSAVQGPQALPLLALTAAGTAAAALLAWSWRVRDPAALGLRSTTAASLAVGLAAGVVARLVTWGGSLAAGGAVGPSSVLGVPDGYLPSVGVVLVAGLLLPAASELLFRGVFYGALRRHGVWVAAPVSAVLFAATHGSALAAVSALVLGLVTALLYERSGSLWPAVAAHAGFAMTTFAIAALL